MQRDYSTPRDPLCLSPPLSRPTVRDLGRGRRALVQLQGRGQVRLQGLRVVTDVERQQQAVGQSQKDVPCRPGNRLVTGESWLGGGRRGSRRVRRVDPKE